MGAAMVALEGVSVLEEGFGQAAGVGDDCGGTAQCRGSRGVWVAEVNLRVRRGEHAFAGGERGLEDGQGGEFERLLELRRER